MDLRETYNRIAEDWHLDHQADTWPLESIKSFAALLPSGSAILDIGCGSGTPARHLAEYGFQVTGIDFSEKMIELSRRNVPSGKFHVLDARKLDSLPGIFDGVFMQAFLLHVSKEEVPAMLERAKEKLHAGGHLSITVKERNRGQSEEETKSEEDYGYPYERFFSYYTLDELRAHLKNMGLHVSYENVIPAGKTRWLQVIAKK